MDGYLRRLVVVRFTGSFYQTGHSSSADRDGLSYQAKLGTLVGSPGLSVSVATLVRASASQGKPVVIPSLFAGSKMSDSPVFYPRQPQTPTSPLPFSPCVVVGDLILVSGQASVDAQGKIISDTFEGEFRRSLENLKQVLETAGSDLAHVVQTRNYVREPEDLPRYNQLYREYFQEPFPARTTITNCLPPTLRFEIEAVAVVRNPPPATGNFR